MYNNHQFYCHYRSKDIFLHMHFCNFFVSNFVLMQLFALYSPTGDLYTILFFRTGPVIGV